ncbi:transmembrane protein 87A-like [Agrilus planipennis]|uniref:Transmembrane protein 87A n=1 Tax=Agrilus planipennis TaxID=224129 RepID=A0A1W4X995_AGRPL|nr:transmembrane protein 87A [Agrilus planipennis]XP_025836758.1 transmembrane protein 87A-like [Agrilus planipennis]
MLFYSVALIFLACVVSLINCLPDEGVWDFNLTMQDDRFYLSKSLYQGSQIYIKLNCESVNSRRSNIEISWEVVQSRCWQIPHHVFEEFNNLIANGSINETNSYRSLHRKYICDDHIILDPLPAPAGSSKSHANYIAPRDGVYILILRVSTDPKFNLEFTLGVHIEIKSDYGYLSAADWPLLPFYGIMCVVYVLYGIGWLVISALQWRDLLRVQFWIGGVILLGMLEKALFYAEFHNINNTGLRVQNVMLLAEWVSCAKRTLARMLVVIVSLGFGIVKPRLGTALHRVIAVGALYLCLAATESYLRIMTPKNDHNRDLLVASVPLAVLDSAICWWIFNALVNTTRTLRLRRNEVKLSLYRHFTNTLIFSVVSSIIFMLYSIKTHHFPSCLTIWKDLWLEDAYWHILFSAVLLVIMILWRPTNNNQRYAFVPLLETGDDEEEEHLVNDAYGVKVRMHQQQKPSSPKNTSVEDEIKWLEENVKNEMPLPILDSDEELVNTHFEVSKMQ